MTRRHAAIAAFLGGLVCAPAGVALALGVGAALIALGALLFVASLLLGWNA